MLGSRYVLCAHSPRGSTVLHEVTSRPVSGISLWHQTKNPTPSIGVYLREEHSWQMSFRSDLKRRSLWLYLKRLPRPTRTRRRTRKLSYRKDDRAMRPIYVCREKFRESLSYFTVTFAEIFNGFLFRSILWMCVQNLKFVALPIPEIIGGIPRTEYANTPFSPRFFMGFCWDGPCECCWMLHKYR